MDKYKIEIKEGRKKRVEEFYKCSDVAKELSAMFIVLDKELPPSIKKKVNSKLKKGGLL